MANIYYRRWGISPRPENVLSNYSPVAAGIPSLAIRITGAAENFLGLVASWRQPHLAGITLHYDEKTQVYTSSPASQAAPELSIGDPERGLVWRGDLGNLASCRGVI